MRAVIMSGFGSPENARLGEAPIPQPGPDEVLIRVVAAGVNPADWKECEGAFAPFFPPYPDPWIPGMDAAGIVDKVGANVRHIAVGDEVMLFSDRTAGHHGTFAEYVAAPARLVAPKPKAIDFTEAAAIPCAALTAYQALFRAHKGALKAGDRVLIHGAAGGMGSFALQFARAAGVQVAATCRAANADYVRALGAEHVIDYQSEAILEALRPWAPAGVDAVVDCVSAGSFPQAFDALVPGGKLVSICTMTDDGDIAGDTAEAERRGLKKLFCVLESDDITEPLGVIAGMLGDRRLQPPATRRFPLERAGEALQALRRGNVRGKLVVQVGG